MRHALIAVALLAVAIAGFESRAANVEIWVAPDGNDSNLGTEASPRATLAGAQKAVRERIAAGLDGDVTVTVRRGIYELPQPLVFGPEDSGSEKFSITYRAAPGERVYVSGGSRITGWKAGPDGVWTASVPGVKEGKWYFRHLFVNGRRAVRARTPNADAADPYWQLTAAESLGGPQALHALARRRRACRTGRIVGDVEVVVFGNWEITRKRLESVDAKAGVVTLAPPHIKGHEAIRPGPGRWCYFENAREMLDQPGEWYLDRSDGRASYLPRPGEEMAQARVTAPRLGCLVAVKGTRRSTRPQPPFQGPQVRLYRLVVAEDQATWASRRAITPSTRAEADEEDGGRWPVIPGAIQLTDAVEVTIEDGVASHLGGSGIEIGPRCRNCAVVGNRVDRHQRQRRDGLGPNAEAEVPVDMPREQQPRSRLRDRPGRRGRHLGRHRAGDRGGPQPRPRPAL